MDIATIFENKLVIAAISGAGGIVVALIIQYLLNKRGVFSYQVVHNRVGTSTDDAIYGAVKVTWNDHPVSHLFLSTVEVTNQSMRDYENVVVRVFSNNTNLLTQSTAIVGTTRLIEFTEEYIRGIAVPADSHPTDAQYELYRSQRDYVIPTMNRGQVLRFEFLNAAHTEEQPAIWLDILHKGVTCKFQVPKNQIFGVPQPDAALLGTLVGLFCVALVVLFIDSVLLAALISFIIGWAVLVPGALAIKLFRKLREILAG